MASGRLVVELSGGIFDVVCGFHKVCLDDEIGGMPWWRWRWWWWPCGVFLFSFCCRLTYVRCTLSAVSIDTNLNVKKGSRSLRRAPLSCTRQKNISRPTFLHLGRYSSFARLRETEWSPVRWETKTRYQDACRADW